MSARSFPPARRASARSTRCSPASARRGTSTFDGLALAWAIARHLVEKNRSLSLFATHYFEMTRLALDYEEVANVHLDAVEHKDSVVFLHAVEEGPASQSYGLQVAA